MLALRDEDRLCLVHEEEQQQEPQIICSLGLFAPKAGAELRGALSEQAGNLANTASEGYRKAQEAAGDWADRGREMYDKARDAVSRGADEARNYVRDTSGGSSGQGSSPTSGGSSIGGSSVGGGSSMPGSSSSGMPRRS